MQTFRHALLGLVLLTGLHSSQAHGQEGKQELTLQESINLVLERNLDVSQARLSAAQSQESIAEAQGSFDPILSLQVPSTFSGYRQRAEWDPLGGQVLEGQQLAMGAQLYKLFAPGTEASLQYGVYRTFSSDGEGLDSSQLDSQLSLQVDQPLLRSAGRPSTKRAVLIAKTQADQSLESLRSDIQTLIYQTCEAYWDLVFRQQDIGVKRQALELAQQQLTRNQSQVEFGSLAPVEVIQAEQAVASADYQLIQAEQSLSDAQLTLGQLLRGSGQAMMGPIHPTSVPMTQLPQIDRDNAIEIALQNDPQLISAKQGLKATAIDLRYHRNQRMPQLDLSTSLSVTGFDFASTAVSSSRQMARTTDELEPLNYSDALSGMLDADTFEWGVALVFSAPIGNHTRAAAYRRAELAQKQATQSVESQAQAVEVSVERAIRQLDNQVRAAKAATRARELSERQLEAEEEKFAVGSTSNFQVLEFQKQLAQAKTQELQSQVSLELALINLFRVEGIILQHYGVQLSS